LVVALFVLGWHFWAARRLRAVEGVWKARQGGALWFIGPFRSVGATMQSSGWVQGVKSGPTTFEVQSVPLRGSIEITSAVTGPVQALALGHVLDLGALGLFDMDVVATETALKGLDNKVV